MSTKKHIEVLDEIQVDIVTDGPAKGWVHTHGLAHFNRPELEIRNVPSLFVAAAGEILNEIADYMLNETDKPVLAGQTMRVHPTLHIRFHETMADEAAGYNSNHYQTERLQILGIDQQCSICANCKPAVKA